MLYMFRLIFYSTSRYCNTFIFRVNSQRRIFLDFFDPEEKGALILRNVAKY